MKANNGIPFFSDFPVDPELDWQMSRAEKYCLINLLQTLKPEAAVEIGTYKGGSLQVLSKFSEKVYSIDISKAPESFLKDKFSNVVYKVADASTILHGIFSEIEKNNKRLSFILVDGDHSRQALMNDVTTILSYPHKHPLTIILHDSFNPQCRKGILSVDYNAYPAVEYVELDYITGAFWHNDTYREMWGGFGIIRLNPSKTEKGVAILESQKKLFQYTRLFSIHPVKDRLHNQVWLKKIIRKFSGKSGRAVMYEKFD